MGPWHNPLYRIIAVDRGPACPGDTRGWLLGRGYAAIVWRVIPVFAVAAIAVISPPTSSLPPRSPLGQMAALLGVPVGAALAAALISAASVSRAWQQGRMDEWRVTPMGSGAIHAGMTWALMLRLAAALGAGSIPAAIVWGVSCTTGWGIPLFTPLEGLMVLVEAWAMLYCATEAGQWCGHRTRRTRSAAALASIIALPIAAVIAVGVFCSIDLSRLGGHLMVIGSGWLIGNLFGAASERALR